MLPLAFTAEVMPMHNYASGENGDPGIPIFMGSPKFYDNGPGTNFREERLLNVCLASRGDCSCLSRVIAFRIPDKILWPTADRLAVQTRS